MITYNEKFYLYRHIRLDKNRPFYIGIGTKPNIFKSFESEFNRAFHSKIEIQYGKELLLRQNI